MTTTESHPWVARRRLALRLRRLRLAAGRTIEAAAAELIVSEAKISRIETSGKGCSERDVRDLCRFYGASERERRELMHEAALAKRRGWWYEFGPQPERAAVFLDFERVASEIRVYDTSLVPGLLQTAEFARAMLPRLRPPGELTAEWVTRTVALRMARQRVVEQGTAQLFAVVDEAALRREILAPAVMRRQIEHLIAQAGRENVHLQVVPFEAGYHAGLEGSFSHLLLPTEDQLGEGTVLIESQYASILLEKQAEVAYYGTIFEDVSKRNALSPESTVQWLERFLRDL